MSEISTSNLAARNGGQNSAGSGAALPVQQLKTLIFFH
jgi:hypothetical protein